MQDLYLLLSKGEACISFAGFAGFLKDLGFHQVDQSLIQALLRRFFDSKDNLQYAGLSLMVTPSQKEYQLLLNCRKGQLNPKNIAACHISKVSFETPNFKIFGKETIGILG